MASLTPKKKGERAASLLKIGDVTKSKRSFDVTKFLSDFTIKNKLLAIKKRLPPFSLFDTGVMAYHGLEDLFGAREKRTDMPGSEELAAHFQAPVQKGKPVTTIEMEKFNKIIKQMHQRQQGRRVDILRDEFGYERGRENVKRASKALADFNNSMFKQYAPTAWRIQQLHKIRDSMTRPPWDNPGGYTTGEALNRDAVIQELRRLESLPHEGGGIPYMERMSPAEQKQHERLVLGLRSVEAHLTAAISGTTKGGTLDLEEWYTQINNVSNHPFMLQGRRMYAKRLMEEERALAESAGGYPAYPYGRRPVNRERMVQWVEREDRQSELDIVVAEYTNAIRDPDTDPALRAQLEEELRSSLRWVRGRPTIPDPSMTEEEAYARGAEDLNAMSRQAWRDYELEELLEYESEMEEGREAAQEEDLAAQRAWQEQMEGEDREDWLERLSTDDMRRANRRNPLADPYAGRERRGLHGGRRYGQDYSNVERPPPNVDRPPPDDDPIPF